MMNEKLHDVDDQMFNKYGSVTTTINTVPLAHHPMIDHNIEADVSTPTRPIHRESLFGMHSPPPPPLHSVHPHHAVQPYASSPYKNMSPYFRSFSPALTGKSAIASPLKSMSLLRPSTPSSAELEHGDIDEKDQITVWQAGFSIVNLFLGLCLLSYPYALSQGGLSSLAGFLFICFALCFTVCTFTNDLRCFTNFRDGTLCSF